MSPFEITVLQAIYTLSDEIDYNHYDTQDIAEYLREDVAKVATTISFLYDEGYLGECMTACDDGEETYHLTHKGVSHVKM